MTITLKDKWGFVEDFEVDKIHLVVSCLERGHFTPSTNIPGHSCYIVYTYPTGRMYEWYTLSTKEEVEQLIYKAKYNQNLEKLL